MFIRYIIKSKRCAFIAVVFLLGLVDLANAQRLRNNQMFEDGREEDKNDEVILGQGVNMYVGKDVVATFNSDFIVVGNEAKTDEVGGSYKIHLDDTSKLNVMGNIIIDEVPGNKFLFNMGKDAYLVMASDDHPQSIAMSHIYPNDAVIIPHLAIDGQSDKFLFTGVKAEKLNVNNSILELLESDLIIDATQALDKDNPISGERGFISNTLNNPINEEVINSDKRGRLVIHLDQDVPCKIPLGYNEPGYNEAPRIITISSNENAILGFQMLHTMPGLPETKDIEKVNDIYYYRLFNIGGNDVNSMKLNMEIAYDRTKEGDFSDLAYLQNGDQWVNFSKVFEYSDLSIKNSSGSLIASDSSSMLSKFRSLDIKDLSLSVKTDNPSLLHLSNAREVKPIEFTLVKGEKAKFFIPSIFTPNHDGINDTFEITGLYDVSLGGKASLEIYQNVRGNPVLVYKDDNYAGGWDGKGLPDGVYFYQIQIINKNNELKKYKGDVTIKRN